VNSINLGVRGKVLETADHSPRRLLPLYPPTIENISAMKPSPLMLRLVKHKEARASQSRILIQLISSHPLLLLLDWEARKHL